MHNVMSRLAGGRSCRKKERLYIHRKEDVGIYVSMHMNTILNASKPGLYIDIIYANGYQLHFKDRASGGVIIVSHPLNILSFAAGF